jgi:hypothetical protein
MPQCSLTAKPSLVTGMLSLGLATLPLAQAHAHALPNTNAHTDTTNPGPTDQTPLLADIGLLWHCTGHHARTPGHYARSCLIVGHPDRMNDCDGCGCNNRGQIESPATPGQKCDTFCCEYCWCS